jgi:hypothetical protein
VLVCAPSNSALDEIVLRVLNTGKGFVAKSDADIILYDPITSFLFFHLMHFFTKRTRHFQIYGIISMHHCLLSLTQKNIRMHHEQMSKLRNEIALPFFRDPR